MGWCLFVAVFLDQPFKLSFLVWVEALDSDVTDLDFASSSLSVVSCVVLDGGVGSVSLPSYDHGDSDETPGRAADWTTGYLHQ